MDVKLRLAVERVVLCFSLLQISAIPCLRKVLVELFQKLAVSKGRAFGRAPLVPGVLPRTPPGTFLKKGSGPPKTLNRKSSVAMVATKDLPKNNNLYKKQNCSFIFQLDFII